MRCFLSHGDLCLQCLDIWKLEQPSLPTRGLMSSQQHPSPAAAAVGLPRAPEISPLGAQWARSPWQRVSCICVGICLSQEWGNQSIYPHSSSRAGDVAGKGCSPQPPVPWDLQLVPPWCQPACPKPPQVLAVAHRGVRCEGRWEPCKGACFSPPARCPSLPRGCPCSPSPLAPAPLASPLL